jgi:hypothetical protein
MFRFRTLAAIALVALIAAPALAADTKNFRVINNSGAQASDLHLTITGTGGGLVNGNITVLVNPPGCGNPAVSITGGNVVNLDWGTNCVNPGDVVIVRVASVAGNPPGPFTIASGEWTFNPGAPIAINVGNDTAVVQVPTVSQWGLIIMTLALLVAATVIFARRRPATAHA